MDYKTRKYLLKLTFLYNATQVLFQETLELAKNKYQIPFNPCDINIANSEVLGVEE